MANTQHQLITPTPYSHVYADGWVHHPAAGRTRTTARRGRRAYVDLVATSHGDVVGLHLTPAQARELAQQLLASAAFVDEAVAVAL